MTWFGKWTIKLRYLYFLVKVEDTFYFAYAYNMFQKCQGSLLQLGMKQVWSFCILWTNMPSTRWSRSSQENKRKGQPQGLFGVSRRLLSSNYLVEHLATFECNFVVARKLHPSSNSWNILEATRANQHPQVVSITSRRTRCDLNVNWSNFNMFEIKSLKLLLQHILPFQKLTKPNISILHRVTCW